MKENQGKEDEVEIKEDQNVPAEEAITLSKKEWQDLSEQAGKSAETQDRLLRLAADFDNFRKRTEQEKRQLATFVESALLSQFLPTLDSLEKITEKEHSEGLKLIAKEIHRTFQDLGLNPVEVLGKSFDPQYAEVVEVTENDEQEEGTVLAVLRPGYLYKDMVLRPALVRISKRKETPPDATTGNNSPGQD
ncbi:MAG: nucleotide exchange factor GrpE [Candidatus Omnitrophota bacterium]